VNSPAGVRRPRRIVGCVSVAVLLGVPVGFFSTEMYAAAPSDHQSYTGTVPGGVAAAAETLAGGLSTGSDWPTFLQNSQRTSAEPGETLLTTSDVGRLAQNWSFATGGSIVASPAIVQGTLYVGSWDGYEYSLDAGTGHMKWRTFLGTSSESGCTGTDGISSSATVAGGVLYVGGGNDYWYAVNSATGNVVWSVYTGSTSNGFYNWADPLIYNGAAYIGIASRCDNPLVPGALWQVNLTTRQVVHKFATTPPGSVGGSIWNAPSVDPATNTVFVTVGNTGTASSPYTQAIVALNAANISQVRSHWQVPSAQAVTDSDFGSSPLLYVDNHGRALVSATNKDGYTYAWLRSNVHTLEWQRKVSSGRSIAPGSWGDNRLFVDGAATAIDGVKYAGFLRALNPGNGSFLWQVGLKGEAIGAPAYANGVVAVGDTAGQLLFLSASSGRILRSMTLSPACSDFVSSPVISHGWLFIGCMNHYVYALSIPGTGFPSASVSNASHPLVPNAPELWTGAARRWAAA
jgi:outer membrane protein assembly factor BamB